MDRAEAQGDLVAGQCFELGHGERPGRGLLQHGALAIEVGDDEGGAAVAVGEADLQAQDGEARGVTARAGAVAEVYCAAAEVDLVGAQLIAASCENEDVGGSPGAPELLGGGAGRADVAGLLEQHPRRGDELPACGLGGSVGEGVVQRLLERADHRVVLAAADVQGLGELRAVLVEEHVGGGEAGDGGAVGQRVEGLRGRELELCERVGECALPDRQAIIGGCGRLGAPREKLCGCGDQRGEVGPGDVAELGRRPFAGAFADPDLDVVYEWVARDVELEAKLGAAAAIVEGEARVPTVACGA